MYPIPIRRFSQTFQPDKRTDRPGSPIRASTPVKQVDFSGTPAEKEERRVSNRNRIRNLQNNLADTSKNLSEVALELAHERKLRILAEEKANKKEIEAEYYEGRARHFEHHARNYAKRIRNLQSNSRDFCPTSSCFKFHYLSFRFYEPARPVLT